MNLSKAELIGNIVPNLIEPEGHTQSDAIN